MWSNKENRLAGRRGPHAAKQQGERANGERKRKCEGVQAAHGHVQAPSKAKAARSVSLPIFNDTRKQVPPGGAFADGGQFLASTQSWSNVPDRTAARSTSMRSAAGRDQRMPGPARRCLKRLMPLSTVPEPMG